MEPVEVAEKASAPRAIFRSLLSRRVWKAYFRDLAQALQLGSIKRWMLSLGLGIGAAFSLALHIGELLQLDFDYYELFFLAREIIISPFAYLHLALPSWLNWLFRVELGYLYGFLIFLIPFATRGWDKQIAWVKASESSVEIPRFLRRRRSRYHRQVTVTTVLITIASMIGLWGIWFGPTTKFFARSIVELLILSIVAWTVTFGASSGYSQIYGWINEREIDDAKFGERRLFYDALRLIYVLLFVAIAVAVIGVILFMLWRSGNYVTYAAVYGVLFMSLLAGFEDWRTIPTVMIAALLMLAGNVVIERLFNPSLDGLRAIVASLPGYYV